MRMNTGKKLLQCGLPVASDQIPCECFTVDAEIFYSPEIKSVGLEYMINKTPDICLIPSGYFPETLV